MSFLPTYTFFFFFFFNDTATTEIYTLSLHDALPISLDERSPTFSRRASERHHEDSALLEGRGRAPVARIGHEDSFVALHSGRSEEHTSELQSQSNLVCRLLLEKKKK